MRAEEHEKYQIDTSPDERLDDKRIGIHSLVVVGSWSRLGHFKSMLLSRMYWWMFCSNGTEWDFLRLLSIYILLNHT